MDKESREWRGIEGYPDYEVSSDGLVRRTTATGYRVLKNKKKKNGYLETKVFLNGRRKHYLVHRLVCTAFNGEPPSIKHQVNHEDGDKENNHHTNLEWVTHTRNQNHARDNRLSDCSYKILVHNIVEKSTVTYRSISLVASTFGIAKSVVETYLRGYPNLIYNQFYKFELLYTENFETVVSRGKLYRVMDYAKGTEFMVRGARLVSYLAKVSEIVVRGNVGENRMVNGFMFKFGDDLSPFVPYPPEAATISKEDYSNGLKTERKLIVTELHSGKSTPYDTVAQVALLLRLPVATIYRRLNEGSLKPFRGYSFRFLDQCDQPLKRAA